MNNDNVLDVSVPIKNKKTHMKNGNGLQSAWLKIFVVLGLVGAVLIALTIYSTKCSGDTCIQKEIDQLRTEKDGYQARINELNGNINELKKGFSAGYVIEQIQTQHMQNVHPDIITFRSLTENLIPKANASSGETLLDVPQTTGVSNVSVRFAPNWISVGRYGKVLAELGSPYASVPIEKYCNEAGVSQYQCDILVGITFQESEVGKRFAKKDANGSIVPADEQGAISFNPAGLKGGGISYPTPEGFYIRPFKSWDDFWQQYPQIMKTGYFDRGGNTPESISKCYVRGDCVDIKYSWANGVKSFMAKLN